MTEAYFGYGQIGYKIRECPRRKLLASGASILVQPLGQEPSMSQSAVYGGRGFGGRD
jgi:hypothetical protein